jgi:hypothetical protein
LLFMLREMIIPVMENYLIVDILVKISFLFFDMILIFFRIAYTLNMTSQRWLTDSDFSADSQSHSIWWHWLVIVVPDEVRWKQNATLYITGGTNGNGLPDYDGEDIVLAAGLALTTGTITGVLFQVSLSALSTLVPYSSSSFRSQMNIQPLLLIQFKNQEVKMLLLLLLGITS